jgi:parallel beta-helix repeat protein
MRTPLLAIAASLVLCGVTQAETLDVCPTGCTYSSIQDAIDVANDGDEVLVAPGTYIGSGNEVVNTLGKSITLQASGTAEETIIDGEGTRRVVVCGSGEGADTIIEGFTITGGFSAWGGGGISCSSSSLTITGCTITNNTAAQDGGGIYCNNNSNPTITGCTILGNTATGTIYGGGGVFCWGSSPTITGCTISGNTAKSGGGIFIAGDSSPTLTDSVVCENAPDNTYGTWTDGGDNCVQDLCDDCAEVCPGDFDGNDTVNVSDLLTVIGSWGDPYDVGDLLLVISGWGPCP